MKTDKSCIEINKETWNKKTDIHIRSDFYDMNGFLNGNTSLNEIELKLLGNIKGKRVLHLQCHFGQDTISLQKLGASVVGIDLSDNAIKTAKEIATQVNSNSSFICCNIYDLPNYLNEEFDIVYTSYGTISWLPDMDKWAKIISRFLKPNGKFIFVEFHPVVWMFDDRFEKVGYDYFNTGAIIETESGTYADKSAPITQTSVNWNHSISEVVNALLKNGLTLNALEEYDYSPYNCFANTIEIEPKKYTIKHIEKKIPMVYALVATKK
jgi:ubiquinone/menaquinone biosynthesis C-methylase UbiE